MKKVCYCCGSKGTVCLPAGVSSKYYLCRACYKYYKMSTKIIKNNCCKTVDK